MNFKNLFSFFIFFFFCGSLFSIELPDKRMIKIKKQEDLVDFVNKIVVFMLKDDRVAISTCWTSYVLGNAQLKFGSVHPAYNGMSFEGCQLIQIIQIVEKESKSFWDIIRAKHLGNGLWLREADDEELVALHESASIKKDMIMYREEPQEGLQIIEKQTKLELRKSKIF